MHCAVLVPVHLIWTGTKYSFTVGNASFLSLRPAGPSTWNSLLKCLRDPCNSASVLGRLHKTFFFSEY